MAVELGASFYEVSAKEDLNVKMAFKAFAQDILENVASNFLKLMYYNSKK